MYIIIAGDHSEQDQTLSVKKGKYMSFVRTIGPIFYGPPRYLVGRFLVSCVSSRFGRQHQTRLVFLSGSKWGFKLPFVYRRLASLRYIPQHIPQPQGTGENRRTRLFKCEVWSTSNLRHPLDRQPGRSRPGRRASTGVKQIIGPSFYRD